MHKAINCTALKGSFKNKTPTTAAEMGNITVKTPALEASIVLRPVIHNQTVAMLAEIA